MIATFVKHAQVITTAQRSRSNNFSSLNMNIVECSNGKRKKEREREIEQKFDHKLYAMLVATSYIYI